MGREKDNSRLILPPALLAEEGRLEGSNTNEEGEKMNLSEAYKTAARAASEDGIDAGNEPQLIEWIRRNCKYRPETEFFLVLGIGCELANMQSQQRGYKSNVHEAYELAKPKEIKAGDRVKHSCWSEEKWLIDEAHKFTRGACREQAHNSFMAEQGEVIHSFSHDDMKYLKIKWDNGSITICRASMAEFIE